jgi:F-type H+-transporting ATPase subunit delta
MAELDVTHETALDTGARQSRLARTYAESLLVTAHKRPDGPSAADVATFLASPVVGKRAKAAALAQALAGASELFRGLIGVLARNNRLYLLPEVASAYRQLLDTRAGRVRVKVASAVPLSDAQTAALTANLKALLGHQEPFLDVRVDPDLLGGLVVQVGDSVIDTSVRSRLQSLRSLLLAR